MGENPMYVSNRAAGRGQSRELTGQRSGGRAVNRITSAAKPLE